MASSRASTPASPASRGESPELLTPRTKIKAQLASLQSSDEEDGAQSPKSKPFSSTAAGIGNLGRVPRPSQSDDEDEDSDAEIRPRGRLAARMHAMVTAVKSPATTNTESVQKRVSPTPQNQEDTTRDGDVADVDEDEDDLPVAPRRLKRKAPREATPDNTEPSAQPQSPGLFVSSPIRSPAKSAANDSESDEALPAVKSDRFKALVERKRQERLAREAVEDARKAERRAQQEKLASELDQLDSDDGNVSSITDDEGGRRLTQEARPTRKASKRAIEEMSRETQRMARNMQLMHEAKTRKRITTASLFERFNYRPAGQPEPKTSSSSRPSTPQTDAEMKDVETPPSSPPMAKTQDQVGIGQQTDIVMDGTEDAQVPSLADIIQSAMAPLLDKGKGKAVETEKEELEKLAPKLKRQFRVKLPATTTNMVTIDSDDELQITTTSKDKLNAVFDSIPLKKAHEQRGFQALRALAQVKSPGKESHRKADHANLTPGEHQAQLHQRARQQAKMERDRRLEMLKAKGVVVQTVEEREREMQEVEDIVGRAREEAQQIMELERAAAKKERKENGEVDPLDWDDSDDEEYQDSANEAGAEVSAVELSGSEDEADADAEDDAEADEDTTNPLFDVAADEAASEVSEAEADALHEDLDDDEGVEEPRATKQRRSRKHVAIISDDEDEPTVEATPKPKSKIQTTPGGPKTDSPAAPTSVLRSATKTFIPGLPVKGPAGLGLTQIFAGTMDDSQMSSANGPTQSMMPDFEHFPDSNFSSTMDEPVEDMIVDTQREETQAATQGVQLNFSQSQMRGLDSLLQEGTYTQASDIELSQDAGMKQYTPLRERFVEPPVSTVETVVVEQADDAVPESPLVRRGRFRRRMETVVEDTSAPVATEEEQTAFTAIRDGAEKEKKRKIIDDFNRKKSKAKEMVHEQADESEDEYAGIGGADGEESDNESLASVKEMIDDQAGNDFDESKLAAFYADRARASDEKEVERLFKDITTGQLRKKRGADYDLSDSDDGGEARRRLKRRQFAKMQKALFSDERVKKMAENPGNQAFLRTIEDRGSDDEMDFLDVPEPSQAESQGESQTQEEPAAQLQIIPDSQPRKPLGVVGENRPIVHPRRTKDGRKPSNIGEVRETLSNLLDERQDSVIPATEAGSDSEDEGNGSPTRSDKENHEPNPRRGRTAVVDRISLKRNSSSSMSTTSRLAFAAAAASSSSFKVPALLRRATTNSLVSGPSSTISSSTGVSTNAGGSGFGDEGKIKKVASKKSGVNAFARENDRRARMHEGERRREERKVRGAEKRMGVVGGLLGKGSFE